MDSIPLGNFTKLIKSPIRPLVVEAVPITLHPRASSPMPSGAKRIRLPLYAWVVSAKGETHHWLPLT